MSSFSSHFERLLYTSSPTLQRLRAVKLADAASPSTQRFYNDRRATRRPNGPSAQVLRFHARQSFEDADQQLSEGLVDGAVSRFLDLGAAPGGWSHWLLTRNPLAHGTGVELPYSEGGRTVLRYTWEPNQTSRYRMVLRDIRKLAHSDANPLAQAAIEPATLDVVLAGAIPIDVKLSSSEEEKKEHSGPRGTILYLKQLFLAFVYLASGGTLISHAWKKPFLLNSEIVLLLRDAFSGGIEAVRGGERFAVASTYQLKCRGFDDAKREDGLRRLRAALDKLESVGPSHSVADNGVLLVDGSEEEIFEQEKTWLLGHFEPLWEFQIAAIEKRIAECVAC